VWGKWKVEMAVGQFFLADDIAKYGILPLSKAPCGFFLFFSRTHACQSIAATPERLGAAAATQMFMRATAVQFRTTFSEGLLPSVRQIASYVPYNLYFIVFCTLLRI